ncbi:hypothetical protein [Deinococcus aquatilis]|uniref:hypothetical protein n=1 Tax=Deinococcus aquatilis TaxID=519440 RepID=UPI00037EB313|nr:hypothetical protein [Deinococcus aquatilis]
MPLPPRSVRSLLLPRWLRFLLVAWAWAWVSAGVAVLVYLLPLTLVIIGIIDFFQGESPFRSADMVPMLLPVVVVVSAVAQGRSWSAPEPWGRPEIWRASLSSLLLLASAGLLLDRPMPFALLLVLPLVGLWLWWRLVQRARG